MNELSLKAARCFAGVPTIDLWDPTTALLLIDMQVSCIRPHGYTIRRLRECGLEAAVQQYEQQLLVVIPNLARVLERFRRHGQTVIHAHVVSVRGPASGWQAQVQRDSPAGSDEAEIIEELAPTPGELIMPKSCSGVFTGTNLDFTVRRLGVKNFVIGGVVTYGCVERAITEGYDLGYGFVLLSDGSASLTHELHENALERLEQRRAHIRTTDWVLAHDRVEASYSEAGVPAARPR